MGRGLGGRLVGEEGKEARQSRAVRRAEAGWPEGQSFRSLADLAGVGEQRCALFTRPAAMERVAGIEPA